MSTLAFPSISTGAYRYPLRRACRIALREVLTFLESVRSVQHITFCCFSREDVAVYEAARAEM